jgi:hypothetical protein
VVGGVVAVGLIFMAGAVGFFVGHATGSDDDEPWRMMDSNAESRWHDGPKAEGPFGQLPGRGAERGDGRRGSGDTEDFFMGPGQGQGQGPGQGRGEGRGQGQGPGLGQGFGEGEGEFMMPEDGTGPGPMMDDDESTESSEG